jgi:hypothetical protein
VSYFPTLPGSQTKKQLVHFTAVLVSWTKQELVHFKKLAASQTMQDFISISDHVRSDLLSTPHTTSTYLKLRRCQQLGPCGAKQLVSGEVETKHNEAVVFRSMHCLAICLKTLFCVPF